MSNQKKWVGVLPSASPKESTYKKKLPALRDWLIEVAQQKEGKLTYGDVMKAFNIDRFSLRHAMDFLGHQAKDRNEPIITALIINSGTRRCSSGLAKEFGILDDNAERKKLYEFWMDRPKEHVQEEMDSPDLEVKAARFVSVEARPDQAIFRRLVYDAFNGKCAISGCEVWQALDAAHKHGRDWRHHNRAEDGYLLRKDLHSLYDNKLLRITDEGKVELDASVMNHYKQFMGKKILDETHTHD
ncbi:MAG: HNH endonuclease [Leptospirales bacterium]